MALVVEDGTGVAAAEAYISVADATTYLASYNPSTAWTALAEADQEAALRQAAQYLHLVYGQRWYGDAANGPTEQGLDWPRVGVYWRDYPIAHNTVPAAVGQANAEAARQIAEGDTLIAASRASNDAVTERRIEVGPIKIGTKTPGGSITNSAVVLDRVEGLLRDLVGSLNVVERG